MTAVGPPDCPMMAAPFRTVDIIYTSVRIVLLNYHTTDCLINQLFFMNEHGGEMNTFDRNRKSKLLFIV